MTFEELNRAMEFVVEQQARLSANLDREEERSRRDHQWSRGMIKQLAVNNQRIVELIASNAQRLDEYTKFQLQILGQLQGILDRLAPNNQKPN